jgi:hypothetical protein
VEHDGAAPAAKYTTRALSSSTAAAGELTGAGFVTMNNSGATPGTYTTRTAAQMIADAGLQKGDTYNLRIVNGQGTGTLTLAAGDAQRDADGNHDGCGEHVPRFRRDGDGGTAR